MKNKAKALAQHLNCKVKEITQNSYDENTFESGNNEYLVVTDDEANELWEQDLDNYIDECILHELPEQYRYYFNNEAWKRDAMCNGRGHSLSGYDGNEYKETVKDYSYYIYRTN